MKQRTCVLCLHHWNIATFQWNGRWYSISYLESCHVYLCLLILITGGVLLLECSFYCPFLNTVLTGQVTCSSKSDLLLWHLKCKYPDTWCNIIIKRAHYTEIQMKFFFYTTCVFCTDISGKLVSERTFLLYLFFFSLKP